MTTLLLHGFTGSPAVFDPIARSLEGRVLRPLLPGHGPTPARVRPWDEEIDLLVRWLEREEVHDAHLVGYSFGGRLGWHLLDRDDLFSRATLIGAHPSLETEEERAERIASDAVWIELLETEGLSAFIGAWQSIPFFESQSSLPASTLEAQRLVRDTHTAVGLAGALRELGLGRMPSRPEARVPVQLVVGALDTKHAGLAEALDLPLALVPGVGHNVVLEAPEAILELLR